MLTALETTDGTRRVLVDGRDGRTTIEIITAIYQAAITAQTVTLPLPPDDPFRTRDGLLQAAPRLPREDHVGRRVQHQRDHHVSHPHRDGATYAPTATTAKPVCEPGDFTIAAVGLDHGHIYGMCNGLLEAGAQLRWVYDPDPAKIDQFRARHPDVKAARSEQEALDDPQVNLVASAAIPVDRADLGLRVLDHGKHYFTDKPPMTTLGQLAQARAKTERDRQEVRRLLQRAPARGERRLRRPADPDGAIGRVIQVMGMGPHRMNPAPDPPGSSTRNSYGGILCDIGSHQLEQVLFYGGSDDATITSARVANYAHQDHPGLEDFGDVSVVLANGATGYCRVDWFTPDALGTWGDGRTFILGTEGYLELRKYTDIARDPAGDHVYLVNHAHRAPHPGPRQGRLPVLRRAHPRLPRRHRARDDPVPRVRRRRALPARPAAGDPRPVSSKINCSSCRTVRGDSSQAAASGSG